MRKLVSFVMTSLDGYTEGLNGEFDWPNVDAEFFEFSNQHDADIDTLLFGRVGYEQMAEYWPNATPEHVDAEVIEFMNSVEKVVVSSALDSLEWNNSSLLEGDLAAGVTALKEVPGKDIALFGSATLTASLIELGLVDELRVMVNPVLLSEGVSLYSELNRRVQLELWRTTSFRNGNVLLTYRPV